MRSVIAALSMVIAATALAQTNPNAIKITFDGFSPSMYDTETEQTIFTRGAVFRGGTLRSFGGNPTYLSPCFLRCARIMIDLPPGSTDVGFDVLGYSRPFFSSSYSPFFIFHDGTLFSEPPTVDASGHEFFRTVNFSRTPGHIELFGDPFASFWLVRIDNVTFTPPSNTSYLVKASLATDALPVIERKPSTAVKTVVIPLGGELHLGLEKGSLPIGTPELAQFSLSTPSFGLPLPGPPRLASPLFPYNSIIPFSPGVAEATKVFQAVHLGTTTVRITPVAHPGDAFDVEVNVIAPTSIGVAKTADQWINDVAQRTGLLPQMVKGQVEQESDFNPNTFRYEPDRDLNVIQPLINTRPYRDYTAPDPRGPRLLPGGEDLDLRHSLSFTRNGVTRRIDPGDVDVTILEIYNGSDCPRWDPIRHRCVGQRWSFFNPGLRAAVLANDPRLQEDAQTPTASSYGWLQVLYYNAVTLVSWTGIGREEHPAYLTDHDSALSNGAVPLTSHASSLYVGSEIDIINWHASFHNYGEFPNFANALAFEKALRVMYHRYNKRYSDPPLCPNYETCVINKSRAYLPARSWSILQ